MVEYYKHECNFWKSKLEHLVKFAKDEISYDYSLLDKLKKEFPTVYEVIYEVLCHEKYLLDDTTIVENLAEIHGLKIQDES